VKNAASGEKKVFPHAIEERVQGPKKSSSHLKTGKDRPKTENPHRIIKKEVTFGR